MGRKTSSEGLPGLPRIDVPCCICLGSEGQAIWPIEQVPRGSEGLPCLPVYAQVLRNTDKPVRFRGAGHMGHRTSSEVLPGLSRIDVPCCVCLGSEGQAI